MTAGDAGRLVKQTFREWTEDKVLRLGAALAYYAIFSIPPLIVIVLKAENLLDGGHARAAQAQLANLIGKDMAQNILQTQGQRTNQALTNIVGMGILLFGATGVFASLQDALNTIWEVRPKPGMGFRGWARARFFMLAMVFGMTFLLMISLFVSSIVASVASWMLQAFPDANIATHLLEFALSFAVTALLFGVMFKTLPDVKLMWTDVWFGAAVTAALFAIGKLLIGVFLGKASFGSAYGAAAPLVVLFLWVYYSSQILLFGAEFTQVYANQYGSRYIVPAEHAEPVTEEKRAQEGLHANTPDRKRRDSGDQAA